jgi:DNA-directed RNA polymerase specialized sigma subunit
MISTIPHVDLTASEKSQLATIMVAGNGQIKKYHGKLAASQKCSLTTFRKDILAAVKNNPKSDIKVRGVSIPRSAVSAIMAVKEIEWKMLTGYSRFIYRQARKWKQTLKNSGLTFSDIYQEVTIGVINAIWNYRKPSVKFLTYVHNAVFNRIMGVANYAKPLSHLQNADIKLVGVFLKKKRAMESVGPVGFDDVTRALNLSPEQASSLHKALQNVAPESSIVNDESGSILQATAAQRERQYVRTGDDEAREESVEPLLSPDLAEAIEKANLNSWEQAVLKAYLTGGKKWRTEVANAHTNPKTGKPYSRMMPILTINKIQKKLQSALAA